MNDAENGVAILYGVSDNPHGVQVVNLINADTLTQQFFVDAVEALDPAFDTSQ